MSAGGGRVTFDMEKFGEYVKKSVLNFKLEKCCFVAPVRTGALTLACGNVILGLIILVNLAAGDDASFVPLLLRAFQQLTDIKDEDEAPNFIPSCIIAYASEIISNALVICAMWRNDLVLLRSYLYYALGVLTLSIMVYSVVFGTMDIWQELGVVASLGTQLYQIMLVRSAMVEIKQASIKNGYTVNLRPNDEELGPDPKEKYTVAIEPEKPKRPLVLPVTKEDISKPVLKAVEAKEATGLKTVEAKEATVLRTVEAKEVTVHSPAKEAFLHESEVKETVKPLRFSKEKVKLGDSAAKLEKVGKKV